MASTPYFYVQVKIGDKETAPGKEYLGIKDLMPIDYIDPDQWGRSWDDIWGNGRASKVVGVLKLHKDEWLDTIVAALSPVGDTTEKSGYRPRGIVFKPEELQTVAKDTELITRWRSPDTIQVVDATALSKTAIVDTRTIVYSSLAKVRDLNSVSSGTYTYGDGTKNYATRAAAYSDIANLTGNLTFQQDCAGTETASAVFTENLNGFTFTDTSNSDHDGNPNGGYLSSLNFNQHGIYLSCEGPGTVTITKLYLKYIFNLTARYACVTATDIVTGFTLNVSDCLFDGNAKHCIGFSLNDAQQGANVWNCKAWDCGGTTGVGFYGQAGAAASTEFQNLTAYGCKYNVGMNSGGTLRNCMALTPVTLNFIQITAATGYNNLGTDATGEDGDFATGSGNIANATALNEVESLTDTDANFLTVRTDATNANDGGTSTGLLAGNTTGIEGYARPGIVSSQVSIGASQVKVTPAIALPLSPASGIGTGGTSVTIGGTGFGDAQGDGTVTFGGAAAAAYTSWSNLSIICTTPAGAVGAVDVVAKNSDENSDAEAGAYTYESAGAPTVTSCTPPTGDIGGGTSVTIVGTNFGASQGAGTVTFGGTAATAYTSWADTEIVCVTPAGTGAVDVVVTNNGGTSGTLSSGYTYVTIPTVTSCTPSTSDDDGATQVVVVGTGFGSTQSTGTITFGGTAAVYVLSWTDTEIICTTPAHAAGAVDVVVTNSEAQSGTLSSGLTYTAACTILSISPKTGDALGGTAVTIKGYNFGATQGAGTVTFGSTAATSYTSWSDKVLVVVAPAGTADTTCVVTVTNSSASVATYVGYSWLTTTYTNTPTTTDLTNTGCNDANKVRDNFDDITDALTDGEHDYDFGSLTLTNTIAEFSTDGTLADNSDYAVPTEQAVKTYVDAQKRGVCISIVASSEDVTTGDGEEAFTAPSFLNGYNVTSDTIASVHTKGVTGTTDVQIRRRRAGADVDVLSTKITIGDEWNASDGEVNESNDDVQTGDQFYVDVDTVHSGTAPKGLSVTYVFEKP